MILVDANILVYAHVASYPQHAIARPWLDEKLNGLAQVGLAWISLLAFARVVTNRRLFAEPKTVSLAWTQIQDWLQNENVWSPEPTSRHSDILGRLMGLPGMSGDLIYDAHLAALALEHGLELISADGDFARFPDLRWHNPLIA